MLFDRSGMHYGIEMWSTPVCETGSSDPGMSHEHAPNRHAVLMGVPVRTNPPGLRNREIPPDKTAGVRRLVASAIG